MNQKEQESYLLSHNINLYKSTNRLGKSGWFVVLSVLTVIICLISLITVNTKYTKLQHLSAESIKTTRLTVSAYSAKMKHLEGLVKHYQAQASKTSLVNVSLHTLFYDIRTRFKGISEDKAKLIVVSIFKAARKYKINPIILYSIGAVASSHRYWLEHPEVTITVDGKKKKVRAVGWGGIIWEWHKDFLEKGLIAVEREELKRIETNIYATAAIYAMFRNMPLKDGIENPDISAQSRYFGGNFRKYSSKIDRQITELMKIGFYKQK